MASSTHRRISSLQTGILKLLPVPLLSMAVVSVALRMIDHSLPTFPDGVLVLAFTLATLTLFAWESYYLKSVKVDKDHLYVAGWLKQIAIPLSQIEHVDYLLGIKSLGLVKVRLKSRSAFGLTIGHRFMGQV